MGLFTVEQGLEYQAEHLTEWKQQLNAKTFKLLKQHCEDMNAALGKHATGYDVFRGGLIDEFLAQLRSNYRNGRIKAEAFLVGETLGKVARATVDKVNKL